MSTQQKEVSFSGANQGHGNICEVARSGVKLSMRHALQTQQRQIVSQVLPTWLQGDCTTEKLIAPASAAEKTA